MNIEYLEIKNNYNWKNYRALTQITAFLKMGVLLFLKVCDVGCVTNDT